MTKTKANEAKIRQGYVDFCGSKPKCYHCWHMMGIAKPTGPRQILTVTSLRCGLGNFAVKRFGTCEQWTECEVKSQTPDSSGSSYDKKREQQQENLRQE